MADHNQSYCRSSVNLKSIIKHDDKWVVSERMSTRMVRCAATLSHAGWIGWQMVVPTKGLVHMSLFGSDEVGKSDIEWVGEKTAVLGSSKTPRAVDKAFSELYELCLPVMDIPAKGNSIGFNAIMTEDAHEDRPFSMWPSSYSSEFSEIIRALRETGAVFKAVIGSAEYEEQENCIRETKATYDVHNITFKGYVGTPVRSRFLLLLPAAPSLRLKAVIREAVRGADIRYIGNIDSDTASEVWNDPLKDARTYPECAVRIMLLEPDIQKPTIGVKLIDEPVEIIPASHDDTKDKNAVVIGHAMDVSGIDRKISIGDMDLRRHYQIIGQTGTGKSTLLANMILSAIKKGYGLTFFDPHGSTIDVVLKSLPEKYASRVRVVRVGDTENPVPLNIWDSDDFEKEERNISDLCELFGDIFDPKREGFVGPRYERWLSTFCKASIAVFGRRASFESIAVISQSQDNMYKAAALFADRYPELAESIRQEYCLDKSNDFHAVLSWYLCKFQRLTSIEQLRKTLGAGTNALDFNNTIDTDMVTLIDLASPAIGAHAARIVGTLTLMKLWNAAMQRKDRDRTHLVVVDEASLFQTNPMPRMLAEGRKFGISMVLSHQHAGQLTSEIRDALEANSANLTAFRLSTKDAEDAAVRFNDSSMKTKLASLDAFNGITSLSVDGLQTSPFTLQINRPRQQRSGDRIMAQIEDNSIMSLVEPYQNLRALTPREILDYLEYGKPSTGRDYDGKQIANRDGNSSIIEPEWLILWRNKKSNREKQMRKGA